MGRSRQLRGGVGTFFYAFQRQVVGERRRPASSSRNGDGDGKDFGFAEVEELGYGPLGLKPTELWSLTLVELSQMAAGYEWRDERLWEHMAWMVSHLMNVSGKQMRSRMTVRKLLKKPTKARDQAAWWARVEKQREERKLKEAQQEEGHSN